MLSILNGGTMNRRTLLTAGGAGLLGLSLDKLLRAEEAGQGRGKGKSVIFLFLFGGPSQYETFDMKPEAPDTIRGPYHPIASRTPGLLISEHLPKLANVSDKFCVLRTMTHSYNDHSGAAHYIQTGKRWQVQIGGGFNPTPQDWPSYGSILEYISQRSSAGRLQDLPNYAVLPNSLGRLQEAGQYRRPGEHAGWLGMSYNPLTTTIDKRDLKDNPYWRDCTDAELNFQIEGLAPSSELTLDRIGTRLSLLEQFDQRRRILEGGQVREFDRIRDRAVGLVASERTRRALDIRQEKDSLRDNYGRHLFGQSCLMARRLVEAGVRFVTVHYDCVDGYSWDSHVHSNDVKNHLLPTFDQALSALLVDLEQRGMLEETLVVAIGEMGRTAQPTPDWGRGHWSTLFPAVIAGAGVRGGTVYGVSDKNGMYPIDHPISPEDLAATIYHTLGIDHDLQVMDSLNRPVAIVDGGRPIKAIFG